MSAASRSVPDEPVGLLIASARRRIKQAVLARAAPYRLAPQQFWFLVAVLEHPEISQSELAHRVRADAPTVSRVIATLVKRKLVQTQPDPADRRRLRLGLTASGERLATELRGAAREIRAAVVQGLSEPELAALRRGLHRIIENLDALVEGPAAAGSPRVKDSTRVDS